MGACAAEHDAYPFPGQGAPSHGGRFACGALAMEALPRRSSRSVTVPKLQYDLASALRPGTGDRHDLAAVADALRRGYMSRQI